MAQLEGHFGSSWCSWSLSCPSCSPSWRQHVQTFAAKCQCRADITYDSPQDASATPPKHPKSVKNLRKPYVLNVFCYPAQVPKSTKNIPRTSQVEPKMAILALSSPIFSLMLAHLGALGRYLAPLVRHLGANAAKHSKKNTIVEPTSPKTSPKMPQPPFRSKELLFFYTFGVLGGGG